MMGAQRITIAGIGVLAPGLDGWPETCALLASSEPFATPPMRNPSPAILPPAERRRASVAIRLALEVAQQAVQHAQIAAADLACVFTSCDGDGDTIHAVCTTLTEPGYPVSPTRFSNSVHNAPAGYWSIASGARAPSTSLCGYDASFAVGLLEAVTQAIAEGRGVLFVASDALLPPPLRALHDTVNPCGTALVLLPRHRAGDLSTNLGTIEVTLVPRSAATDDRPDDWPPVVPAALRSNPAARALPLLAAIARRSPGTLRWAYGETTDLAVHYQP